MSTAETMAGWARRVHAESDVPEVFAGPLAQARLGGAPFPLVLFSPTFRFDLFEVPPKLLAVSGERVVCLEQAGEGVKAIELRLPEVYAATWGTELLNSWLRLEAHGSSGSSAIRVDFNTASRDLFRLFFDEIRARRYRGLHTDAEIELAKFDPLGRLDFKLMSFGRQSLVDGAVVHRFHLQSRVTSTGPAGETVVAVPASLAVLTQKELILIREGGDKDGYYAGVWNFLALDRIERLEVLPATDRPVVELRAVLPGGGVATSEHARERESELRAFADGVVELRRPPAQT